MRHAIRSFLTGLYNRLILINNPYYFHGLPRSHYVIENNSIILTQFGLRFPKGSINSIIQGYPFAIKILNCHKCNAKFTQVGNDIFLEIKDLRFRINSSEELFILYEVFVSEIYRYNCLRKSVFVDIGMNTGITSLYYAKNPLISSVFAYELFKPTFQLGQENLRFNGVSTKVSAFNFGLSDRSFRTTLEYSLSRKGRMGLKGLPTDEKFSDVSLEEVEVKEINSVFRKIILDSQNQDLIVKMDCEGEELTLIRSLGNSNLLENINVLIIEYHYIDPQEIERLLGQFNFHVFSNVLPSQNSGMIYASR